MSARPVRMILLAGIAVVALTACQSLSARKPPPKPVVIPPAPVQTISRPLPPVPLPPPPAPKACVPKTLGLPPHYPDTDAALRAAGGAADRYQLLAAGRILRQQRLEELERVIAGCR